MRRRRPGERHDRGAPVLTERKKPTLELVPAEGVDPEVGLWLSALRETRSRLGRVLHQLPNDAIDTAPAGGSTIGAILYHVAAIEADWLYADILGLPEDDWPAEVKELFPVDVREESGELSAFVGETLQQHLARLETVRTMLFDTVRSLSPAALHELREREDYRVSAAWTLHHLMQHEAEHRSQIGAVRIAIGAGQEW